MFKRSEYIFEGQGCYVLTSSCFCLAMGFQMAPSTLLGFYIYKQNLMLGCKTL